MPCSCPSDIRSSRTSLALYSPVRSLDPGHSWLRHSSNCIPGPRFPLLHQLLHSQATGGGGTRLPGRAIPTLRPSHRTSEENFCRTSLKCSHAWGPLEALLLSHLKLLSNPEGLPPDPWSVGTSELDIPVCSPSLGCPDLEAVQMCLCELVIDRKL